LEGGEAVVIMLSRVADSLYWMSRYMERTDGILRTLKINYASSQDDRQNFSWEPVLKIFTFLSAEKINALAHDPRAVLQFLVTDKDNPNSVLNIVTMARENGRSVQDHITKEMWQCLNDFYHTMRDKNLEKQLKKEDPITVLDILQKKALLYFGTTDVTMSRGEGNSFINMGKFLERAIQSIDILDIKLSSRDYSAAKTSDVMYWKYLLMSLSGYELYLKTYRSGLDAGNVVEQVVLNDQFPRSVIYCINRLHRYFERLKNDGNAGAFKQINFMTGKLKSEVQFSTSQSIIEQGIHVFLLEIKTGLYEISDALGQKYFAHA
jgi:uncharacterized alpha-E superfamily protein